jgi:hypothetical protein
MFAKFKDYKAFQKAVVDSNYTNIKKDRPGLQNK